MSESIEAYEANVRRGGCPYCNRPNEGNPSDYYHYHECWEKDVLSRMSIAGHTKALLLELERAQEVGH